MLKPKKRLDEVNLKQLPPASSGGKSFSACNLNSSNFFLPSVSRRTSESATPAILRLPDCGDSSSTTTGEESSGFGFKF